VTGRLHVRRAGALDAGPMAALLNAIIRQGGTTAIVTPLAPDDMRDWIGCDGDAAVWHLAEDDRGTLLGFQWIAPHPDLPPEACDIATFVRIGKTGLGIGSALFAATRAAAAALGYGWINASIRSDNSGGLIYYQSRGFEDHGRKTGIEIAPGLNVDKILKRFDLR